ncbi:MAG: helicase C-terminal domain-containing protein, partial [Hyphomicrobiaceae bacterium]
GEARTLHGDVGLAFEEADELADLVKRHLDRIRQTIAAGGQVIAIFDSLAALHKAKERLAALLTSIGVGPNRRLAINSSDDKANRPDDLFASGADKDPKAFDVILATSSVELGMTLRATLMLMDPGFGPASFVQRVGRAARGETTGHVVVRVDAETLRRKDWLASILYRLRSLGKPAVTVDEFLHAALAACRRTFEPKGDFTSEAIPATFSSMPQRATWCAGLFWVALEHAWHLKTGQRRTLKDFAPKQAGVVGGKLKTIRGCGLHSAKEWVAAFEAEALKLRFILPSVWVVEPDGRRFPVPWTTYTGYADLRDAPAVVEPDPKTARSSLFILLDRPLREVLGTSDKTRPDRSIDALYPHVSGPHRVGLSDDPVEEWLREAKKALDFPRLEAKHKEALGAAISLVAMSRIVPAPRSRDGVVNLAASTGSGIA